MDGMDYWRLCDEVTVVQAALLIVGQDPSGAQEYIEIWEPHNRPQGYDAAFAALTHAILGGRLPATLRDAPRAIGYSTSAADVLSLAINARERFDTGSPIPAWNLTSVTIDDLRNWLRSRGFKTGFFFPETISAVPYLDPEHTNYAPKLAAAINAWEAVSGDPSLLRTKTAKQALVIWLRKNAAQYGMTKDDGNPNEQGIEEVSKIANWDLKGGAPKTPGA